jgi:flagella basal body P-ring formation protein FlgA
MHKWALALGAVLVLGTAATHAADMPKGTPSVGEMAGYQGADRGQKLLAAARLEGGELSVYHVYPALTKVIAAFSKEYGIDVKPWRSSSEAVLQRVVNEARSGRFDAAIEIPSAGGKRPIVQVSGRATATVEVATAARTIERGGVLKDADLIMERRTRSDVGRDVITNPAQAVGLAARSNLQPGHPIRSAELMKPDLVQRNDVVTIIYEVPGVVLTIRGKAAEGGAEGDVINVLNEQSKRTLQGVIVGPGRVAINNGSPRVASSNPTGSIANANTR